MAEHKETTDKRQLLTFFGLATLAALFFGYVVLPYASPKSAPLVGKDAPNFTLPVLNGGGNRLELASLRGKVVVLDFWASWCGPCRQQAPIIELIHKSYPPSEVAVVGVNTADPNEDAAKGFIQSAKLSYPSVRDDGEVAIRYGATTLPTLVVIGKDGTVRTLAAQVFSERELRAQVDGALGDSH